MHEESRPRPPYLVKAAVAQLLRQVFSEEPVQDMDFVELFAGGGCGFPRHAWLWVPRLDHGSADLFGP